MAGVKMHKKYRSYGVYVDWPPLGGNPPTRTPGYDGTPPVHTRFPPASGLPVATAG